MTIKNILILIVIGTLISSCYKKKTEQDNTGIQQTYKGTGAITKGIAQTTIENIFNCNQPGSRLSAIGEILDLNNKVWTVPATNNYLKAIKAFDLYNECTGVTPDNLSDVDLNLVPVSEIDSDGEIVTGFIFADNYFELYINGQLIVVDPVPFTPFNSNVVKFRVTRPYSIALKLIDWEENLGVGSEEMNNAPYHAGDGGFIASFSDGIVTNNQWKAQTFYTAPIRDLSCLQEIGQKRLSTECNNEDAEDGSNFYGIHWDIPANGFEIYYNDSDWPNATTYTEDEIGVDNKKAYMNFIEKFSGAGAEFIWSTNVILDNEVIIRYRAE